VFREHHHVSFSRMHIYMIPSALLSQGCPPDGGSGNPGAAPGAMLGAPPIAAGCVVRRLHTAADHGLGRVHGLAVVPPPGHACMRKHMNASTCCTYVLAQAHARARVRAHVCVHARAHARTQALICACTCAPTCTRTHMYTRVRPHPHPHPHTRTLCMRLLMDRGSLPSTANALPGDRRPSPPDSGAMDDLFAPCLSPSFPLVSDSMAQVSPVCVCVRAGEGECVCEWVGARVGVGRCVRVRAGKCV